MVEELRQIQKMKSGGIGSLIAIHKWRWK